jgi:hypothetical protein
MNYSLILKRRGTLALLLLCLALLSACQNVSKNAETGPTSLSQVPAVRLSFRYEADVPGPPEAAKPAPTEDRNAAVQSDFDQNRAQEILDKTVMSPDKKRVLAVYHQVNDIQSEFRLDMYSPDGKLLRKVTPDTMAVHFPDTITWAPDSSSVAFVAMVRAGQIETAEPPVKPDVTPPPGPEDFDKTPSEPGTEANANTNANAAPASPSPAPPVGVLTFRTEQIYLCDAEGDGIKPLTQSEGKIYFYFAWSPDSRMLASMAATQPEWRAAFGQAEGRGEVFVPPGRLRIVEKTGRERLLDDALTQVHPVWSPDSSKVAAAFDTQIRIYDAIGTTPTQAGIQLRNQLLLSSQAYDQELQRKAAAENEVANNSNVPPAPASNTQSATTLPDPSTLVSFSPIVDLEWTSDDILYFQTGYIKEYKNAADSRRSYLRWHRLVFSPQAQTPAR